MNSPVTALVVVGGDHPSAERAARLRAGVSLVVAADSGYDTCLRLGLVPDAIIGDMDSVQSALPQPTAGRPAVIKWPRDKDFTDTELAIAWAREQGAQRIVLLGGGGGRIDHLLAVYTLFQREDAPDCWYTVHDELILVRDYLRTFIPRGTVLSFFPAGSATCRVRSQGLHWPLNGLNWNIGDGGVSNLMDSDELELQVDSGRLLLVRQLAEGDEPIGLGH